MNEGAKSMYSWKVAIMPLIARASTQCTLLVRNNSLQTSLSSASPVSVAVRLLQQSSKLLSHCIRYLS